MTKIVVIGDTHDSPKESKRRFEWFGKFITDERPEALIQIGDVADLDSLCSHIGNATYKGKHKPSFEEDLVSLNTALDIMDDNIKVDLDIKHMTLGNHCERAWRFEDEHPETYNTIVNRFTGVLEAHNWSWTPYGQYYNCYGVDFVHRPLNIMRRPTGGEFPARSVAAKSARDTVFGDTHRFYDCRVAKLGTGGMDKVRALDVGCALEWGQIKDYAKFNQTGWWWGVVVLDIRKGHIEGVNSVPMYILEEKYAVKQVAVPKRKSKSTKRKNR